MVEYGFVGSIKPSGLLYPNISALLICLQIDYIKLIAICQYLFEKIFFCNKCVLNNCLMAAVVPRSAAIISESPDVKLIPTCGRTKLPRQKLPGQLIFRSVCRLSEFRFTVKKGLGVPFLWTSSLLGGGGVFACGNGGIGIGRRFRAQVALYDSHDLVETLTADAADMAQVFAQLRKIDCGSL